MVEGWSNDATTEYELSKVEIMDTSSKQWYLSAPLPQPCCHVSTAIAGNMLLLVGGCSRAHPSMKVFGACLDDLIHQTVSTSANTFPTQSPWCTLPDTPLPFSTALSLNGALLAVGGQKIGVYDMCGVKTICLYQPNTKTWVKAGEMPIERWQCACVVLPNGEVFVAGNGDMNQPEQVDIAVVI